MLVRVQLRRPEFSGNSGERQRLAALALAAIFTPSALVAFTMALWRIAADLHWTSAFAVSKGLFSHWQVWLGTSATYLFASALNRYGRGRGETLS